MKTRLLKWVVVLICLATAVLSVYVFRLKEFMAIDRCMDAGGAYEKSWKVCDKSLTETPDTRFSGPVFAGMLDGQKISLQLRDLRIQSRGQCLFFVEKRISCGAGCRLHIQIAKLFRNKL